jgi:lysophospholipase L1-like esterase
MMRWLLLALVLTLSACGEAEKLPALPSGSVVLALGDSLTAGAGVTPEQAWHLAGATHRLAGDQWRCERQHQW